MNQDRSLRKAKNERLDAIKRALRANQIKALGQKVETPMVEFARKHQISAKKANIVMLTNQMERDPSLESLFKNRCAVNGSFSI